MPQPQKVVYKDMHMIGCGLLFCIYFGRFMQSSLAHVHNNNNSDNCCYMEYLFYIIITNVATGNGISMENYT